MITGTLSNGFQLEIDETKVKTYKFAKLVGMGVSKNVNERLYATASILTYLLGEEGEEALLEYIEKQTGKEPTEQEVASLTIEIINLMKTEDEEIKKSSPSVES